MRRTYISPEFEYVPVYGTFNMNEESSFFGSKMLEIADSIEIKNENIIYYQNANGEQLNESVELALPQIVYDTVADKQTNHTLTIDDSQTEIQKNGNAKWILDVNIRAVLRNYIFANLKKFRTFESVQNLMVKDKNVNSAILNYIDNNVLNRYKFERIEFFYKPVDLLSVGGLKYKNTYDVNIELVPNTVYPKIQTETDPEYIDVRVIFFQDKPASQFSFKYYFNLYFEKL